MDPDKGVIVLTLAYGGLRRGELGGLHVADVDTSKRRIHVRRNAVNVGGVVEVGTPKPHERRTVPLPRFLVEPLAAACQGKGRDGIVFPAGVHTLAMPSMNLRELVDRVITSATKTDPPATPTP